MTMEAVKKTPVFESVDTKPITYPKLFWLFMIGSVIGVPLEGFWCLLKQGHWETHVVSMWGPFCIIYGIGAVGFYLISVACKKKNLLTQFLALALVGAVVECLCGWFLDIALHMRAWDYSAHFLNINGYVSLSMTILWGMLGLMFIHVLLPPLDRLIEKLQGKMWCILCRGLTIFMVINLMLTSVCIVRWKNRHEGIPPINRITQIIDKTYPDDYMQKRFCEWSFIDD